MCVHVHDIHVHVPVESILNLLYNVVEMIESNGTLYWWVMKINRTKNAVEQDLREKELKLREAQQEVDALRADNTSLQQSCKQLQVSTL